MKIVFRISKLGFGGAEQVFISIAREIKKEHNAEVIFVVDQMDGENVATVKRAGFDIINLNVARTLMSIIPFARVIMARKPDAVISAYTDTNAACLLSKVISPFKVPVIVSEHASLKEHWQNKSSLKKIILKFYVGWIYKLANKVLCVSDGLREQVNGLLQQENKTLTIHNPVRFNRKPRIKKAKSTILNLVAVGRVSLPKDYSTLIKALVQVKKERAVHLKIVGGTFDSSEFDKVRQLVTDHELEENVEFVGYSDAVDKYYKDADIFVLSSAWEGFGNVIVEAMAFGLPIVATNCNYGPAEILDGGRYGRLVDVADSNALAVAIVNEANSSLVDEELLFKRSEDFSESKIAKQYYQLIEEQVKK